MSEKVTIDGMSGEIQNLLEQYSGAVASDVKDCCRKVAKRTVKKLRDTSPKRTGTYKKKWGSTITAENAAGIQITVHSGRCQLSHLLEHGHAKRGGGRTSASPHIKPVEEEAANELMEEIEKIL